MHSELIVVSSRSNITEYSIPLMPLDFDVILLGECKLSCVESLFLGSKPMVTLSLAELPGNTGHMVLAMGGLDNQVHIYCGERTGKVCKSDISIFV